MLSKPTKRHWRKEKQFLNYVLEDEILDPFLTSDITTVPKEINLYPSRLIKVLYVLFTNKSLELAMCTENHQPLVIRNKLTCKLDEQLIDSRMMFGGTGPRVEVSGVETVSWQTVPAVSSYSTEHTILSSRLWPMHTLYFCHFLCTVNPILDW